MAPTFKLFSSEENMKGHEELFSVSGKTAIVTGSSSGLGVAFAQALARAGACVVLVARRVERLQEVARQIESNGGSAEVSVCDVGDSAQVERLMEVAWSRFGRVDVLVNNAGVVPDGGIMPEKLPHDIFEQTVRINLLGVWYCCRAAGARMLADGKGGSIINIASSPPKPRSSISPGIWPAVGLIGAFVSTRSHRAGFPVK